MALDQAALLPLDEFINRFVAGDLTTEDFLVGAVHYPGFYPRLEPIIDALPLVSDPEGARLILITACIEPFVQTEGKTPQIYHEKPADHVPIEESVRHASDTTRAIGKARESQTERLKTLGGRAFTDRLAKNFTEQVRLRVNAERAATIEQALKKQPANPHNRAVLGAILQAHDVPKPQREQIIREAFAATPLTSTEHRAVRTELLDDAVAAQLVRRPQIDPLLSFALADELAAKNPDASISAIAQTAIKQTTTLGALTQGAASAAGSTRSFYKSYAKGLQKIIAPAADFVFHTILPVEAWREGVVKRQIAKAVIRAHADQSFADSLNQRFEGAATGFFNSPLFQSYLQQAQQELKTRGGVGALWSTVTDVVGEVAGKPDAGVRAVIENGAVTWKVLGEGQQLTFKGENLNLMSFHMAAAEHQTPGLLHLALAAGGQWGVNYGLRRAATGAVAEGAKKGAAWLLGKLGLSALGGPVGTAAGFIVGFGGSIFKAAASFFRGDFLQRLILAESQGDWKKDGPLLLAGGIVIAIVFLFTLPFLPFFNLPFVSQLNIDVALVTSDVGGGSRVPLPDYDGPPPEEESDALECPITSGRITQGPHEGKSHKGVDAYDFGSPQGSEVRATHGGIVSRAVDGIPLNQFCNGGTWCSFGNFVQLVGKNGAGEEFFTTYAHMMPGLAVRQGQTVQRGQLLGYVDATGYTFGTGKDGKIAYGGGTHLHYQYDGPGELVLPPGCGGTTTTPPRNPACTTAAPRRILPIGDSITSGYTTPPGYRGILEGLLESGDYSGGLIGPLAYPNTRPGLMVDNVANAIAGLAPDIVLVHAGTVEVHSQLENNKEGIEDIIKTIKAKTPSAQIYLATIIPRFDLPPDGQSAWRAYNNHIRSLAGKYSGVRIVEMATLLSQDDMLTDGVHPTMGGLNSGYGKIASAWLTAIRGAVPVCKGQTPQ